MSARQFSAIGDALFCILKSYVGKLRFNLESRSLDRIQTELSSTLFNPGRDCASVINSWSTRVVSRTLIVFKALRESFIERVDSLSIIIVPG